MSSPEVALNPDHPRTPNAGVLGAPSAAGFLEHLHAVGLQLVVPAHSALFVQGDEAAGIHLIRSGQVKLAMNSSRGRTLILRIAEPGELLGLHNCLSPAPHEVTAETLQRCELCFVRRDDFLRLLARDPQVLLAMAGQLSRQCHSAYGLLHSLATSNCISERLARLLLDLAAGPPHPSKTGLGGPPAAEPGAGDGSRVAVGLTHEEIAQMIGTSRETVTRLLKEFRTRRLAMLKGSTLHIYDRMALEQMVPADGHPGAERSAPALGMGMARTLAFPAATMRVAR